MQIISDTKGDFQMRKLMILMLVAGVAMAAMSQDLPREIEVGRKFDQDFCSKHVLVDDPVMAARINAIGQRIVAVSERPGINYTFRLYDGSEIDGFSVPGGYVYVSSAMANNLQSDDEVAALLSHEIAHVSLGQALKLYDRAQQLQKKTSFLNWLTNGVAGAVAGLNLLRSSRKVEAEADAHGGVYVSKANFDPIGEVGLMRMLADDERAQGDRTMTFLKKHPDIDKRFQIVYDQRVKPMLGQTEKDFNLPMKTTIYVDVDGSLADKLSGWEVTFREATKKVLTDAKIVIGQPPADVGTKPATIYFVKYIAAEQPSGTFNLCLLVWQIDPFDGVRTLRLTKIDWIPLADKDFCLKVGVSLQALTQSFLDIAHLRASWPELGMVLRAPSKDYKGNQFAVSWKNGVPPTGIQMYKVVRSGKITGQILVHNAKKLSIDGETLPGDILVKE